MFLKTANTIMLVSLLAFIISTALAYGFENQLPLLVVVLFHVAQLVLAGVFKIAYVLRLIAQKQSGLAAR